MCIGLYVSPVMEDAGRCVYRCLYYMGYMYVCSTVVVVMLMMIEGPEHGLAYAFETLTIP